MSDDTKTRAKFVKLFDDYHQSIYRFLLFKLPTAEIAQDLTSDTFTKVWSAISDNADIFKDNPRAYLYKTAYNCMADHYRSAHSQKEVAVGESEVLASLASSETSSTGSPQVIEQMGDAIDLDTEKERLIGALKQMSGQNAELLTLRYIEDLTNAEIAEILGKPEGTVRVGIHRAIIELKSKLKNPKDP